MNINNISSSTSAVWLKKPHASYAYHRWLVDDQSLTAKLQRRYPDFAVKSLSNTYAKPLKGEASQLKLIGVTTALIREVLLYGSGYPLVFAHSVLPRSSLRGDWRGLGRLGNKPLGATLFSNPKVKRTRLNYKKISINHPLYKKAAQYLKEKPAFLWARRSVFSLKSSRIMVTEVLLPQLLAK